MTAPRAAETRGAPERRGRTITVAVDGSDSSWRAVSYAVGVATRYPSSAHLVLAYVERLHGDGLNPEVMALRAESEGEMRRALGERIAFEFADLDISWELRTLSGEWRTQIRAVAREVFTDVVVVGARSRIGGWGTRRLASALIADATWPVIAVP